MITKNLKFRDKQLDFHFYSADLIHQLSGTSEFTWEAPVIANIVDSCSSTTHGTILDIGANSGLFSNVFYNFFDYDRLVCIEMHSAFNETITANAPNCEIINKAAYHTSNKTVRVSSSVESNNSGTSKIIGEGSGTETIAIDELNITDLTLVKMDVEGAEIDVLRGMKNTIDACSPVMYIEIHTIPTNSKQLVFEFMRELNYEGTLISDYVYKFERKV